MSITEYLDSSVSCLGTHLAHILWNLRLLHTPEYNDPWTMLNFYAISSTMTSLLKNHGFGSFRCLCYWFMLRVNPEYSSSVTSVWLFLNTSLLLYTLFQETALSPDYAQKCK